MKRFNIWALLAIVALIISVSTAGCTSNVANQTSTTGNQTSSVSQTMATYDSGNFTMQYPSDWKTTTYRTNLSDIFSSIGGGASLSATKTASIGSLTLSSYTNSRINTLKSSSNYTLIESGNTTLAGNPAYKVVYTFNSGGISGKIMEIWTFKDGNIYTITYTATPETYDANIGTAQNMIGSFQIK